MPKRPVTSGLPARDSIVRDKLHDRVGVVMSARHTGVFLRPVGGGLEWEVLPEDIVPATEAEKLSARVAAQNQRSRDRYR